MAAAAGADWTGRPFRRGEARHRQKPWAARRIKGGGPRFWALVTALADAVQDAGTLTWRKARDILLDADQRWLIGERPRMAGLSGMGAGRPQNNWPAGGRTGSPSELATPADVCCPARSAGAPHGLLPDRKPVWPDSRD